MFWSFIDFIYYYYVSSLSLVISALPVFSFFAISVSYHVVDFGVVRQYPPHTEKSNVAVIF
mgnify:CR=1 FL=1